MSIITVSSSVAVFAGRVAFLAGISTVFSFQLAVFLTLSIISSQPSKVSFSRLLASMGFSMNVGTVIPFVAGRLQPGAWNSCKEFLNTAGF